MGLRLAGEEEEKFESNRRLFLARNPFSRGLSIFTGGARDVAQPTCGSTWQTSGFFLAPTGALYLTPPGEIHTQSNPKLIAYAATSVSDGVISSNRSSLHALLLVTITSTVSLQIKPTCASQSNSHDLLQRTHVPRRPCLSSLPLILKSLEVFKISDIKNLGSRENNFWIIQCTMDHPIL